MKSLRINRSHIATWSLGLLALATLLVWAQPAMAGQKYDIALLITPTGAEIPEAHPTPAGVVHIYYPAVYNLMQFTEGPLTGLSGNVTWEGSFTIGPTVSVGSGTGVIKNSAGVGIFLTKWHYQQQLFPLEPFTLRIMAVGIGEYDGVWFEVTAEGYDPYAPYECVGLLMNPQGAM